MKVVAALQFYHANAALSRHENATYYAAVAHHPLPAPQASEVNPALPADAAAQRCEQFKTKPVVKHGVTCTVISVALHRRHRSSSGTLLLRPVAVAARGETTRWAVGPWLLQGTEGIEDTLATCDCSGVM